MTLSQTEAAGFSRLADILLPGRGADWPAASAVLGAEALRDALAGLADLAAQPALLAEATATTAVRNAEAADSATFARALGRLTDAYYGTAAVQARCKVLADAAPWPESGRMFDPALLRAKG